MNRSNSIFCVSLLTLRTRSFRPQTKARRHIRRHIFRRNDVVLELGIRFRRRNSSEYPEEVFSIKPLGFHADATRAAAGKERFDLNMGELRTSSVATKNIGVRTVAHRNNRNKTSTAKLASNKELAGVSPGSLYRDD